MTPSLSSPDIHGKKSLRSRFGAAIRRRSTSAMSHVRTRTVSESDQQQLAHSRDTSASSSASASFFLNPKESYKRRRTKSNGLEAFPGRGKGGGEDSAVAVDAPSPVIESPVKAPGVAGEVEEPIAGMASQEVEEAEPVVSDDPRGVAGVSVASCNEDVVSEQEDTIHVQSSAQTPPAPEPSLPAKEDQPSYLDPQESNTRAPPPTTPLKSSSAHHSRERSSHSIYTPDSGIAIPLPTPSYFDEYLSGVSPRRPRAHEDDSPTPSCSIRTLPSIHEQLEDHASGDPFLFTPASEHVHSHEDEHAPVVVKVESPDDSFFLALVPEDVTHSPHSPEHEQAGLETTPSGEPSIPSPSSEHVDSRSSEHENTVLKFDPAPPISIDPSADSFLFSSHAVEEDTTLSQRLNLVDLQRELKPTSTLAITAPAEPFAQQGWSEYTLPTGTTYYAHSTLHCIADFALRSETRLERVMAFVELGRMTSWGVMDGMEMWVRNAAGGGEDGEEEVMVRNWVDHGKRMLWVRKPDAEGVDEDEFLAMEHHYWRFVEAHPAHVNLLEKAKTDAMRIVQWSYTDSVLSDVSEFPTPFTRDECSQLLQLLNIPPDVDSEILQTRLIARIFIRLCKHKQARRRSLKLVRKIRQPSSLPASHASTSSSLHIVNEVFSQGYRIRTAMADLFAASFSFGLPYFYLERRNEQVGWVSRRNEQQGVESTSREERARSPVTVSKGVKKMSIGAAGPMVVFAACTCVSLAWSLSRRLRQLYPSAFRMVPWASKFSSPAAR